MIETVVLIDSANPEDSNKMNEEFKKAVAKGKLVGINVLLWHDLVTRGMDSLPPTPASSDSVNTLCYTSGTTGMPKGVILTHKMVCTVIISACRGPISTSGAFEVGSVTPHIHAYKQTCIQTYKHV